MLAYLKMRISVTDFFGLVVLCALASSTAAAGMSQGKGLGGNFAASHHKVSRAQPLQPRNAAQNYLNRAKRLSLTEDQIQQLTTLRDEYNEKTAIPSAHLSAKRQDLKRFLYAEEIDVGATEAMLEQIQGLERDIWRVFIRHKKALESIITPEQRFGAAARYRKDPH